LAESQVLGGTAAGRVRYNWRDDGRWSASLEMNDVHTEPLAAAWPGVLDAQFDASGQLSPFRLDLALQRFEGTLRGLPVAGSGGLKFGPDELRFREFRIDSGDSSLALDGMLNSAAGIDFDIDIEALGTLLRPASGALAASGNIAMSNGFPRLDLVLDARDLGWQQYRAGKLAVETVESAGGPLAVRLSGEQVELGGRVLQTVGALLAAGPEAQRIEAELATAEATLAVALDGAFDDWRQPLASAWRGRLASLQLTAGTEFALALERPSALTLSPESMVLDEFCLADPGATPTSEPPAGTALEICGSGHWAGAGDFRAAANLAAFPVGALGLVFDPGLDFTQTLDGSMTFSRTPGRALSGDMQLDISAGRIRNRLDERMATTTRPGVLQMHLEDGQLLSGQLRLPFSQASEIEAHFEVLDVGLGEASPVEGELRLEVKDIGIAGSVTPMIDAASGQLAADVVMSGTAGEPRFTGQGSLTNGSLTYAPLGLRLEDMELSGNIRDQNRLELEGTFRAGEGSGRIYTSADYLAGAQAGLQMSLSGQDLTVVDVPDLRVVANPELDFGLDDGTVTINGRIVLPRARLSPVNLTATAVRESEDVVVVAGQQAEVEETPSGENGIAVQGEVELTLGDDIVIDLDVADTKVTGATTFRWSGPTMPRADGQYRVSGSFQAYGQLLQITEGIVNFPNVPANNPVLRIRAEREIFGNSQIRSAGVFITGTAKDPDVEVYTTPRTNESRALTLLVTGSDFDFDQGVGAVDVGTYIAPKLYLSYGIGLFARENVISLRYDIAKGFGIKASSSTRTDGIDLSYTIER
jgi:translocation and assembly module TamB